MQIYNLIKKNLYVSRSVIVSQNLHGEQFCCFLMAILTFLVMEACKKLLVLVAVCPFLFLIITDSNFSRQSSSKTIASSCVSCLTDCGERLSYQG